MAKGKFPAFMLKGKAKGKGAPAADAPVPGKKANPFAKTKKAK